MSSNVQSSSANPKVDKDGLSTECARCLRRKEPCLLSTATKGHRRKCEGCRKAKVACTLAGTKDDRPSIRKSSFSSSDYEDETVLVEGEDCKFISLPEMKKILENKKNQKIQKTKKIKDEDGMKVEEVKEQAREVWRTKEKEREERKREEELRKEKAKEKGKEIMREVEE